MKIRIKKIIRTKSRLVRNKKMISNRSKRTPYVQVSQNNAKKGRNLIKNTPSKLQHIHQRRGVFENSVKHLR